VKFSERGVISVSPSQLARFNSEVGKEGPLTKERILTPIKHHMPEKIEMQETVTERKQKKTRKNSLIDPKAEKKEEQPFFLFQPDISSRTGARSILPPIQNGRELTLVLDLDETLIHFEESKVGKSRFLIRPFTQKFLKKVAEYYEVVIFTAAVKEYADYVLDKLDTDKCISHRLYRNHTDLKSNVYQKDLSKLGRPLSKILIVDNNPENFQLQPDNGVFIKSWYDDPEDKALHQLSPILIGNISVLTIDIAKKNCEDVRVAMKQVRDQMIRRYSNTNLFN